VAASPTSGCATSSSRASRAASPATPPTERSSRSTTRHSYRAARVPLLVLAGKDYGTGSSRDWAAKGPALLGVRAVLAESFERIHRSNLVGTGILPLQFRAGDTARTLGLTGHETFTRHRARRRRARPVPPHRHRRRRRHAVRGPPAPRHPSGVGSCGICCATCSDEAFRRTHNGRFVRMFWITRRESGPRAQSGIGAQGTIRSLVPARIDRLPWSPFHTRMVAALGVVWILDGL
jgi:hypothetical protein